MRERPAVDVLEYVLAEAEEGRGFVPLEERVPFFPPFRKMLVGAWNKFLFGGYVGQERETRRKYFGRYLAHLCLRVMTLAVMVTFAKIGPDILLLRGIIGLAIISNLFAIVFSVIGILRVTIGDRALLKVAQWAFPDVRKPRRARRRRGQTGD